MKKINELKSERAELISKMETISNSETLTDELRAEWTGLDTQIKQIDSDIALAERQEELNKINAKKNMETTEARDNQPVAVQFRDWLKGVIESNNPTSKSFRVNPMLSTSNSNILNKTVEGVDTLYTPGEAFLRQLGVTIWTGLNGQVILPTMGEHTASYITEANCGGDASLNIANNSIAPRRISASQIVTRELLAQTNPDVYQSILNNLTASIWAGVVADAFDVLDADASTQIVTSTATALTYAQMLQLEASLGSYALGSPAYVTSPTNKASLKGLASVSNVAGPAWVGNEMNGYPAYAHTASNGDKVYFGDWSKFVVGQWGDLEIIVDPYTYARYGEIQLTVLGMFDSGTANKAAFAILDPSIY